MQVWLWEVLWCFFLVHHWLPYKIHFWSHIIIISRNGLLLCRIREDDTLKMMIKKIFFFGQLMRYPLIKLFHLYNLLQMSNDYRMVHTEFFTSFSYCKRTSFDDCSQLVIISFWWLVTTFLIVKALVSFAKLLKLPLLCMFISNSWAKCVVDIAVCLLLDDSFRTQMRKLLYLPRNMEYLYIYAYVICLFLSSVSYNFPYKVHLSPQVGLFLDIL